MAKSVELQKINIKTAIYLSPMAKCVEELKEISLKTECSLSQPLSCHPRPLYQAVSEEGPKNG